MPAAHRDRRRPAGPERELLESLTAAQRAAVLADEPVLCVLAGAGAGKTGVLTARVARRCRDGSASASHTLVCTFSRKAADELRLRLFRLGVEGVTAGTIHRVALRIVTEHRDRHRAGAPRIVGDRRRLLGRLTAASAGPDVGSLPTLDTEIGWAKANLVSPEGYEALVRETGRTVRLPTAMVASIFADYEQTRLRRGLLDLDDLLVEAGTALQSDPELTEALRWRHRHLYVDEMQDVNPAQFALVRALAGAAPDLFVVGDPDQSIYGWNGADPHLLFELGTVFPELRVLRLDENHRSTPAIVRCAEAVLGEPGRRSGTRADGPAPVVAAHEHDAAEARWVARQARLVGGAGRRWSQIAVLARTNAQLPLLREAFEEQRIPCVLAGGALGPASDLGQPDQNGTLAGAPDPTGAEPPQDAVVLSTFHRAKGLQWPCVFVVGLSEGLVPITGARSPAALAEERRLLYVALSRAEDELFCSWARAGSSTTSAPRQRCRWLEQVEHELAELARRQRPAGPEAVAGHLARLRALVGDERRAAGEPVTPWDRSRR